MINIDELKNKLFMLNNLLDEYDNNFLNLYKILDDSYLYWDDSIARQFYFDIAEDKKKVKIFHNNLLDLYDIYLYICNKYSRFASKIEFDLSKIDSLINLFENYTERLNDIIKLYHNLDYNFGGSEFFQLAAQEESLKIIKSNIVLLKDKNKDDLVEFENLENDVSLKISKINIEKISPSRLKKYTANGLIEKSVMDVSQMSINLRKLVMYKIQTDINFENICETVNDINYKYMTDNTGNLTNFELILKKEMKNISSIYENYVTIINENIEKYLMIQNNIKNIFDNRL